MKHSCVGKRCKLSVEIANRVFEPLLSPGALYGTARAHVRAGRTKTIRHDVLFGSGNTVTEIARKCVPELPSERSYLQLFRDTWEMPRNG